MSNSPNLNGQEPPVAPGAAAEPGKPNGARAKPAAAADAAPRAKAEPISPDRRVVKGKLDPLNEKVTKVYVSTDHFMIYTASGSAGDVGRLRYILPDDYEAAKALRAALAPISGQLAYVSDILASLRGFSTIIPGLSQLRTLRDRTLDLMARASQLAFEGQTKTAQALLERCREEVTNRRDSRNRMRYIFANMVSLMVILYIIALDRGGGQIGQVSEILKAPETAAGVTWGNFRVVDVLAFGAIGAFFAVSADIKAVKIRHSISIWEMLYAGFVRVPIGVIAASVVILLVSGGWILSSVGEVYQLWTLYLFGFLAGFSEFFVPNALKEVERTVVVQSPGAIAQAPEPAPTVVAAGGGAAG